MKNAINWLSSLWMMKWSTFTSNYGWSNYVPLFDGWIARGAMAVPVVGYLILFNDSISEHLSFNRLAHENFLGFGLSSINRLKFIYFGLIFLGSANIIYRLRKPFVFKIGKSQFDYVENALKHFTASAYIDIHGTIRHEGHLTLHGKYYDSDYASFINEAVGRDEGEPGGPAPGDWTAAKNRYESLLRSMLTENFFRNNIKRRYSLTVCIVMAFVGYLLLLIPSADLFVKVLVVSVRPLLS
jgi:hypothetical protein